MRVTEIRVTTCDRCWGEAVLPDSATLRALPTCLYAGNEREAMAWGWTRYREGGRAKHLCPDCSERVDVRPSRPAAHRMPKREP